MRAFSLSLLVLVLACAAYLLFWPVRIEPVAWDAPADPGFSGIFAANNDLTGLKKLPLDGRAGPSDAAVAADGDIYFSTRSGHIMRLDAATAEVTDVADTGGRPAGLDFSGDGTLLVADAEKGLLAIDDGGNVSVVADTDAEGKPLLDIDDVAVTRGGTIYVSQAPTTAAPDAPAIPVAWQRDLVEHAGGGRVLKVEPDTGTVTTVLDGLQHPGGIVLTGDQSRLLVSEAGAYRVVAFDLEGRQKGVVGTVLGRLPGFPGNVDRARDGTFWLGLTSPRSGLLDALSGRPFLRKMLWRLPAALRPTPSRRGVLVHFDQDGNVLETLQDPTGAAYAYTTGAVEGPERLLFVTSLTEDGLGVIAR